MIEQIVTTNETTHSSSIVEAFAPGQKLGESRFTLKEKIFTSDIGVVWLADDSESGKEISLLFLPDSLLEDARALDDLRGQVKQNRQLIHPRVLRTHDFIEEPGWAAISSDAVEAETFASLLAKKDNGCFNVSEIKPRVTVICQTLDEAHRANLLHRDLSPNNILLTKTGDILIANFGISRIILDALDRARTGEKGGGHLAYVSPQQLDGEHPARWDDVYSLGMLIYVLLTGKSPFSPDDIVTQIRKSVPASITSRREELGIKGEPVPENWEKVVAACLSKHTPQRPKSAREVGVKLGAEITVLQTAVVPPAIQATPPPDLKKAAPERKESTPERREVVPDPNEELVEDILWKKAETQAVRPAPRVNPASPFAHLLEKIPEEPKERKFPVGKAVAAGLGCLIILLLLFVNKHGKPVQKTAVASPSPTQSVIQQNATPAVVKQPVATPQPVKPAPTGQVDTAKTPLPTASATPPAATQKVEEARKVYDRMKQERDAKAKLQQTTESDAALAQKALDAKLEAAATLKKATDDAATTRKQLEDAQAKAAADSDAAQKAAAEKTRIADEAKKATDQVINQIKDQQTALQKADAELPALQKDAADKQKAAADAVNAAKDAEAQLQLQELAVKEAESDAAPQNVLPEKANQAEPVPTAQPGMMSIGLTPIAPESTPNPIATAEQQMVDQIAKQKQPQPETTPFVSSVPVTYVPNPKSKIDKKMENSLGMKFAPVGDVLFCIWPTRLQDFQAFVDATGFKGNAWSQPGFKQGPDHPVVNVTWQDAIAFCKWLTDKEQKAGLLAPNQIYRLPTDLEWSKAVGLPDETGKTPEMRDMDVTDVYPWGKQWPPPQGAGNYTGEETGSDVAIKGYDDGYAWTSPVGSFNINKYGLYDMGGNVWQWCMDWWNGDQKMKVLRGASWYNGGLKLSLLSSCRLSAAPDITTDNYGFRCVIATETKSKR